MVRFVKINLSALLLAVALAATAGAAPLKDNGTGPDGIFIIPSKFAMRCDISSHDVHDDGKIEKMSEPDSADETGKPDFFRRI